MKIIKTLLSKIEYFQTPVQKTQVVLHHTVSATGKNVASWFGSDKGKSRVAVAYVVEVDGTVYQLYESDSNWAYHIGKGSTKHHNEVSIGIEIANEGSLTKKGDKFYWFDGKYEYKGKVVTLTTPFRGVSYFASYSDAQFNAVVELLDKIFNEHPTIKRQFSNTFDYDKKWLEYNGVVMHVNLRKDKTDLSPAFDIKKLNDHITKK